MSHTKTPEEDYKIYQENKKNQKLDEILKQIRTNEQNLLKESENEERKRQQHLEYEKKCQDRRDFVKTVNPTTIFHEILKRINLDPGFQDLISKRIQEHGETNIEMFSARQLGATNLHSSLFLEMDEVNPDIKKLTTYEIIEHFYNNGNMSQTITEGKFKGYQLVSYTQLKIVPIFIVVIPLRQMYIMLRKPFSLFDPRTWI